MSTLGQRLVELRGKMSRKDFAERLGIHHQTIYEYEKNRKTPTYETIKKISLRLNINPDWLNSGVGPIHPGDADSAQSQHASEPGQQAACPRCAKLEAKLEKVEAQRDDLAQENRQLLRENGELKVKVARLEAEVHKPPELGGRYGQSGQTA